MPAIAEKVINILQCSPNIFEKQVRAGQTSVNRSS